MKFFFYQLIISLFLINLSTQSPAQEKDWYDSLEVKKEARKQNRPKDTTHHYEPHVSWAMFNHFNDNPGFCGSEQRYKYQAGFRLEMPFYEIDPSDLHPRSYFASFEMSAGKKRHSGIGAHLSNETAGAWKHTELLLAYSFKFHWGRYHGLRLGIASAVHSYSFDWNALLFPDQISKVHGFVFQTSELMPGELNRTTIDINAGVSYAYKRLFAGFSVSNITGHDRGFISLDRVPRCYRLNTGYTFIITPQFSLSPSLNAAVTRKEFAADLHVTGLFFEQFIAGISLEKFSTPSVELGYNYKKIFFIYLSAGINAKSDLYRYFGPLQYAMANIRFQLGTYQREY